MQKPEDFLCKPNQNVLQNTYHAIFSVVADCMSFKLGFNELLRRDSKMCKSYSLFTLSITEKLDICKGRFLVQPWSLMAEFTSVECSICTVRSGQVRLG